MRSGSVHKGNEAISTAKGTISRHNKDSPESRVVYGRHLGISEAASYRFSALRTRWDNE